VATARRRTVSLASAAVVALLTLAVGFGAGYAVRRATSTSTTTPSSTTTSSSSSSSTSSSIVPLARCTGAGLSGRVASSTGAAGTVEMSILVSNLGATACSMLGYPSIDLLNANGQPIATTPVEGHASFSVTSANAAPRLQRLPASGTVRFMLQYSDVPAGTETSCLEAAKILVSVPPSATSFLVGAQLTPCDNGSVYLSPWFGAA